MTLPQVLVTRAAQDAARWVAALQREGIPARALPLIAIRPLRSPALQAALQRARRQTAGYRAVMFVSGHAARHFFEQNQAPALAGQALAAIKTRYWAPGPGTVRALQDCGVAAAAIDGPGADAGQFDSEALWQQVAPQIHPGERVLIVRGTDESGSAGGRGRDWLAAQILGAGAQVDFVASYERGAPAPGEQEAALARAASGEGFLWLLCSGEALRHLLAWLPGHDWSRAHALATHPRIAQAAQAAGFGHVATCRPAPADVASSIKSLYEH